MSNWEIVTLDDVAESINTGLDAIRRAPIVSHKTDLRCLRIQDISQNKPFDKWGYTEVKDTDFKKFQLVPNDIIMARTCSTGICYLVKEELPAVFNNGLARIRLKIEKVDPQFIYYIFKSKHFSGYIDGISGGTSVQLNMKIGDLSKYQFKLPPLSEQKEIARILSDLDKKIEINTQINQTLEQIAQAIFKSWFVDFDPVRAKAAALASGKTDAEAELAAMQAISGKTAEELAQMPSESYAELAEIAKAFPSAFGEDDVPMGWRQGTFADITKSRREKVKDSLATVLSAVSSGELVKSEEYFTKQVHSKSIDKYLKVYQWDFAYNPARINIGSIGLHENDYLGAVSPVYEVFSVTNGYHWFMKRVLDLETTKIKIQTLCTGSVRQTLKLKDFQSISCVIPSEKSISVFNRKWEEYRAFILNSNENTKSLSETRDLLLPRLLSGEIQL
ncbi:restriction endonuclease subunit S [Aggregatibacter actinomycetemcomitans]|uniref:restriction endonuclease subunit S n=1 Tax=Aggregatibacter actinomycetemcomitans TaxID=714 RepID=UPI00197C4AD7|nr:restriction endonuclease subunit S [Aggregatibacter actinomycetemcomitans]MBN6064432.1 restriction endonuclease subunit S [Aggregatibacter actinomycetemcomitans]MBN6084371.1 restriction endonuclease subunit S [Aggregatibacter actinomycetemcomitans]